MMVNKRYQNILLEGLVVSRVRELAVRVAVPRDLVKAIRQRGHDAESFILEAVAEKLSKDPREECQARLAIAEHMLRRAKEELGNGDAVQASEKLYKAVEECIKILACLEELEECGKAREEGRWWTKLLARAARRLSRRLGERLILEAWSQGYDLHIHGFHEHSLGVEDVEETLPLVEKLVSYTRRVLEERLQRKGTQRNKV